LAEAIFSASMLQFFHHMQKRVSVDMHRAERFTCHSRIVSPQLRTILTSHAGAKNLEDATKLLESLCIPDPKGYFRLPFKTNRDIRMVLI
jgi:hypothetical protein